VIASLKAKKNLRPPDRIWSGKASFFFFFFFFFFPGSGIELKKKVEESWLQYKGLLDNGLSTSTYRYICTIDR